MTGYTCPGTWAPCEDSAGHEDDPSYEVKTEEDCVGDDTTCNPDKKRTYSSRFFATRHHYLQ